MYYATYFSIDDNFYKITDDVKKLLEAGSKAVYSKLERLSSGKEVARNEINKCKALIIRGNHS